MAVVAAAIFAVLTWWSSRARAQEQSRCEQRRESNESRQRLCDALSPEDTEDRIPCPLLEPPTPPCTAESVGFEQQNDSAESDQNWAAFPLGIFAPETGFGLGAFGVALFHLSGSKEDSRPSSVSVVGLYTTRSQLILELIPEFYFNEDTLHFWSKYDMRIFPNSYWGVGNDTPASNEERFLSRALRFRNWARYQFLPGWWLGLWIDGMDFRLLDTEDNGLLEAPSTPGREGAWTLGFGPTLDWDTRDNVFDTRHGHYYHLTYTATLSQLGSDFNYHTLSLDARQFWNLGKGHVLAAQVLAEMNFGDVPFHQMALIGGKTIHRGYFEGRYRDKHGLEAQLEYRFPLFWRFRGALFAAAGDVAARPQDFDPTLLELSAGGGLRVVLSEEEKLNLRADFGVGVRTTGFYIAINEAF